MRRLFGPCVCLSFVLLFTSAASAAPQRNVLLLVSDNQNWDDRGCYGNDVVQIPNIDRLRRFD